MMNLCINGTFYSQIYIKFNKMPTKLNKKSAIISQLKKEVGYFEYFGRIEINFTECNHQMYFGLNCSLTNKFLSSPSVEQTAHDQKLYIQE